MHELGVTNTLIKQVLDELKERDIRKISEVVIEVGRLTSYSGESLVFYYDLLKAENERLKESSLIVEDIEPRIICKKCNKESVLTDRYMVFCPLCSSNQIKILSGHEFILKNIRV